MPSSRHKQFLHCIREMIHFRSAFHTISENDKNWFIERLSWHKLIAFAAAVEQNQRQQSQQDNQSYDSVFSQAFERIYLRNIAAEENYYNQCKALWSLLNTHNIDFIAYKGPFFANNIYPYYHYRHIGDIDLIMSVQDAQKLSPLLQQQGYQAEILGQTEADDFNNRGELTLHAPESAPHLTSIQIHWHLMPAPRFLKRQYIINDDFFNNVSDENWRGLDYLLPSVEARFLYLALHASCQHQFNRLILLVEMAMLLAHGEEINWSRLFTLAKQRGAQKPLFYALSYLQSLYPLPITAVQYMQNLSIGLTSQLLASPMSLASIIDSSQQKGRLRRKLFRTAMS